MNELTPGQILSNALQGPNRPMLRMPVSGYDASAMAERAKATNARVIETGANIMIREPHRISKVLYPHLPQMWPTGEPVTTMLAACRKKIAAERNLAVVHPHIHDMNRLVALLQAEKALVHFLGVEIVAEAIGE